MAALWQALAGVRLRQSLRQAEAACDSDPLTGLPNRRALHKELSRPATGQFPVMVGLLDLNRFKDINDTHGHACGDALLVAVASRLRQAMHGRGLAARLGGDEFVLLWNAPPGFTRPGSFGREQAIEEAQRILTLLSAQPVSVDGLRLHPEGSLGLALALPDDEQHPHQVLHAADVAMYAAKCSARKGMAAFHIETTGAVHGPERRQGSRVADAPPADKNRRPQPLPARGHSLRRLPVPRPRNRR